MHTDADTWRIDETVDYICTRKYTIIACQFPDDFLNIAPNITSRLQHACSAKKHSIEVYILADTTYNSLSVDEVAASHINAHCVIHYGRASLTSLSHIPAFYIFPIGSLDIDTAVNAIVDTEYIQKTILKRDRTKVIVILDQLYVGCIDSFRDTLVHRVQSYSDNINALPVEDIVDTIVFAKIVAPYADPDAYKTLDHSTKEEDEGRQAQTLCRCQSLHTTTHITPSDSDGGIAQCNSTVPPYCDAAARMKQRQAIAGYFWQGLLHSDNQDGDGDTQHSSSMCFLWVGPSDAPALQQLQLTYNTNNWLAYDPDTRQIYDGIPLEASKLLRRRYFLVEKARHARVVGILVGTLGAAGYNAAIENLREMAQRAGKKTYTLLMGKPSPAKLANFPEIEVFVLVADPQGQILDSKEYLSPIITPYEAMMSFTSDISEWNDSEYRLDFGGVVDAATTNDLVTAQHRDEARFSFLHGAYQNGKNNDISINDNSKDEEDALNMDRDGVVNCIDSSKDGDSKMHALVMQAREALSVSSLPDGADSRLVEVKSAADYYVHRRTWKGVETPAVGAEEKKVVEVVEGTSGRAAGYSHEK